MSVVHCRLLKEMVVMGEKSAVRRVLFTHDVTLPMEPHPEMRVIDGNFDETIARVMIVNGDIQAFVAPGPGGLEFAVPQEAEEEFAKNWERRGWHKVVPRGTPRCDRAYESLGFRDEGLRCMLPVDHEGRHEFRVRRVVFGAANELQEQETQDVYVDTCSRCGAQVATTAPAKIVACNGNGDHTLNCKEGDLFLG
jgi:hypothetical protein